MSKAVLSYQLPEEREEFEMAYHGASFRFALEEIDSTLRSRMKHEDIVAEVYDAYDEIRGWLNDALGVLER